MQRLKFMINTIDKWILILNIIILCAAVIPMSNVIICLCLLQIMIQIFYIALTEKRITHLVIVFLAISFVFNISRISLEILGGYTDDLMPKFSYWFDDATIRKSLIYYMLIHFFVFLGFYLSKHINLSCKKSIVFLEKYKKLLKLDRNNFVVIGVVLFVIGLVPKVWIDINRLMISIRGNYFDIYQFDLSGVGGLSMFYYIGACSILIAFAQKKKIARILMFVFVFWELITIVSGKRYDAITFYVMLVYIYFSCIEKINKRKLIYYIIACFGIVIILNTIRYARVDSLSLDSILKGVIIQFSHNPIFEVFAELGSSFLTLVLSIDSVPSHINYGLGVSYLSPVWSLIPFLKDFLDMDKIEYIKLFDFNWAMGGNWIAESYYNFGYIGVCVGGVVGYFLSKLDDIFSKQNNFFSVILVLPLLFASIKFIRNYFSDFRIAIIQIVVIFFLIIASNVIHKYRSLWHFKKEKK